MHYLVAVYWPSGGYGGADKCHTLDEAKTSVAYHKRLGYGKASCPIHVIKHTPDSILEVHDKEPERDTLPKGKP